MTQNLNLLLFDGFSNHCLANFVEPLRAANTVARRPLYDWRFLSLNGAAVHSSSGLTVAPQRAVAGASGDMLAVMPSYGFLDLTGPVVTRAVHRAASRHETVVGLDTGSWLMAQAGLLDGRRATIHWEELSRFEEAFPHVETVQDRFVIDGNRLTCSGAMAAYDLATTLIEQHHGPLLAMEVAGLLMHQTRPGVASGDALVARAVTIMQTTLETPLPIRDIARNLGCSQKTLEQRMRAGLHTTPQALYRRLRLNLARKLASETRQSVAEIASRCGYDNPSAMTRAFKAEFGLTPTDCR